MDYIITDIEQYVEEQEEQERFDDINMERGRKYPMGETVLFSLPLSLVLSTWNTLLFINILLQKQTNDILV